MQNFVELLAGGADSLEIFHYDRGVRYCQARDMKKLFRILGFLVFAAIVLFASAMLYSTVKGYTTWYFRVNGQVTVDGHTTSGYIHVNTQRTLLLLTRTDGAEPETYLVSIVGNKQIFDCGDWHPIRFLPVPIGHLNPPCSVFTADPAKVVDPPVSATLAIARRSIEFSTVSGKRVKAEW
jgi:hypothetical protein